MRIVSTPPKPARGPKHPPWLRTFWLRPGTVVEHDGHFWELDITGAADQVWRTWRLIENGHLPHD